MTAPQVSQTRDYGSVWMNFFFFFWSHQKVPDKNGLTWVLKVTYSPQILNVGHLWICVGMWIPISQGGNMLGEGEARDCRIHTAVMGQRHLHTQPHSQRWGHTSRVSDTEDNGHFLRRWGFGTVTCCCKWTLNLGPDHFHWLPSTPPHQFASIFTRAIHVVRVSFPRNVGKGRKAWHPVFRKQQISFRLDWGICSYRFIALDLATSFSSFTGG